MNREEIKQCVVAILPDSFTTTYKAAGPKAYEKLTDFIIVQLDSKDKVIEQLQEQVKRMEHRMPKEIS